ncbi:EndoU domain-containing protein [Paenibacillus athensensis]|nr:pre-toxin TG domain-containing protein [Paenibacillus athensensis]MCD1259460.1 EndoU domain-containing protein [Paenibacillus athensensis]
MNEVRSGAGLLVYGLEVGISARRGISGRLNKAQRDVDGLQQRLASLYACMQEAMDRYQRMEDGLASQARHMLERQSLPSSYPDIPGLIWSKVPDNMKQQLLDSIANAEQQKYNIPGLHWDQVPANLRDQLRASIDQAAQQRAYRTAEESTELTERNPQAFKAMVGGYEREHPGSHTVYYIDGQGNRTLMDFDRLQELVAVYNRQGGNYLPGDILLMMPVDYTPFFLYVMQMGYDPRTFQPLDPQNLEAMTGYVIGRKVVEEESREKARAWESLVLDLTPIVGSIKAVVDLSTGKDSVTGRELGGWDYGLAGAALIAPAVAKPIAKGISKGVKAVVGAEEAVKDGARVGESVGSSYKTVISDEMKEKILLGQRKDLAKNELIGGHSPEITNTHPNYAVEVVSINTDGTKKVKFTTQFPDGNLSKIKTSTIFPESWPDKKILDHIAQIGDTPMIGQRIRDGATLHRGILDGVQIEVIKIGDHVISGYPTGGGATALLPGFH